MAVKKYRALEKGYVNGRIIREGEVFSHEFTKLERDDKGEIVRNQDKTAKTTTKDAEPSWVEEISDKEFKADKAEAKTAEAKAEA